MEELTIGEVAQYAGMRTSAIRYYESVGLLPRPTRVNGRRRYDPGVLKRLGLIQLVRQAGFGIRELQLLFNGSAIDAPASTMWKSLAVEKIAEMDALIERTQAAKAWLAEALQRDCQGAEECVALTFDETGNGASISFSCEKMVSLDFAIAAGSVSRRIQKESKSL
ncbi:MAG TPA: MerR family transcriptional regulator [Anaerolineales bacterium]|nr:MerR family transcriptional regulator [Anaerolineales bacterium]